MSVTLLPAQRPKGRMGWRGGQGRDCPSLLRAWTRAWLLSQSIEKSLDDLCFLKSCFGPCADGDWAVEGV